VEVEDDGRREQDDDADGRTTCLQHRAAEWAAIDIVKKAKDVVVSSGKKVKEKKDGQNTLVELKLILSLLICRGRCRTSAHKLLTVIFCR
jgi:hypothetical protein